ncbi:MAG: hypothetical protein SGPRY_011800 [Prymnesium sp.]
MSVVTYGEALLTYKQAPAELCIPNAKCLSTGASIQLEAIGGAELNVAVALAHLGVAAKWCSLLPHGPLGDRVANAADASGVDLSCCLRTPPSCPSSEQQLGTLHVVDEGMGPKPHYQRLESAFCKGVGESTFAWADVLNGCSWLHLTGITPLLGRGPRAAWSAALKAAKQVGVQVFFDLNHRPALGTFEELWAAVEADISCISLLMLSEDALLKLCDRWAPSSDATSRMAPDWCMPFQTGTRCSLRMLAWRPRRI